MPERRNLNEGEDSEGDLAFSFIDACIELGFEEFDDFLDARGKAGSEDVAIGITESHRAVEIIRGDLKAVQFGAGLDQLCPLFYDELEIFDPEDLLHDRHLFARFRGRNDGLLRFCRRISLFLFVLIFDRSEDGLCNFNVLSCRFPVSRFQYCGC